MIRVKRGWRPSGNGLEGKKARGGGYRMNVWPAGTLGKNAEKGDPLHFTHNEKDQCSAGQ